MTFCQCHLENVCIIDFLFFYILVSSILFLSLSLISAVRKETANFSGYIGYIYPFFSFLASFFDQFVLAAYITLQNAPSMMSILGSQEVLDLHDIRLSFPFAQLGAMFSRLVFQYSFCVVARIVTILVPIQMISFYSNLYRNSDRSRFTYFFLLSVFWPIRGADSVLHSNYFFGYIKLC